MESQMRDDITNDLMGKQARFWDNKRDIGIPTQIKGLQNMGT